MGATEGLFKSFFPDPDNFRMMLQMADDDTAFEMASAFLGTARTTEAVFRDGLCHYCYLMADCAGRNVNRTAPGEPPCCPYYAAIHKRLGGKLDWRVIGFSPSLSLLAFVRPYVLVVYQDSKQTDGHPKWRAITKVAVTGPVDIIIN